MNVDLFDFELPNDRIALRPAAPRDSARLLVLAGAETRDLRVSDLPGQLRAGDCLVFNDTRVIPAQLEGLRGEARIGATLHKREGPRRWRAFIQIGIYQKAALWAEGPYEITYVKENGVWKFRTMHWFGTYFTPFDQGWAKMSFGNNGPSKDFPPDAPPSIKYDAFPGHFVPPFHYPNPVTGRPWTMEDSRKYSTEGMDPSAAANAPSANSPLAAPAAPRQ